MKAITRHQYGQPDVLQLEDIECPVPKSDELLIRVHYTTVNRTDCGVLTGKPLVFRLFTGWPKPKHIVPGTDFAGEVVGMGSAVSDFNIGERVWGFKDDGWPTQAEYVVIPAAGAVAPIPEGIDSRTAVASAEGAHYAYNFINKVPLKAGDKVLLNGATGAIGSAALQLLKNLGVYVTAVGHTAQVEWLRARGADKIYCYDREDFTQIDQEKYHFIFDAVGKSNFANCKPLLLPKGVYISSELGPGGENLYLPLLTKLRGGKRVIFPTPKDCRRSILYMSELLRDGKYQPLIDRTYQPAQAQEAYTYVMSGQKMGNVLLDFT